MYKESDKTISIVPRHILCDMDGTLIDSENMKCEAWRLAVKDLTQQEPDVYCHRQFYVSLIGLHKQLIAQAFAEHYEITDKKELLVELRNKYRKELYADHDLLSRSACQYMIELLERFRSGFAVTGVGTVSLVSSAPAESVTHILTVLRIEHLFDHKICGKTKSPENPEAYQYALAVLESQPDECLAIEDSVTGYRSARSLGIPCLLVPNDLTRHSVFNTW